MSEKEPNECPTKGGTNSGFDKKPEANLPPDALADEDRDPAIDSIKIQTRLKTTPNKTKSIHWPNRLPIKHSGYSNKGEAYELETAVNTLGFQLEEQDALTHEEFINQILQNGATFIMAFRQISTISNDEKEKILNSTIKESLKNPKKEQLWALFSALKTAIQIIPLLSRNPKETPFNLEEIASAQLKTIEERALETSDTNTENPRSLSELILEIGGVTMLISTLNDDDKKRAILKAISGVSTENIPQVINTLDAISEIEMPEMAKRLLNKLIKDSGLKDYEVLFKLITATREKEVINETEAAELNNKILDKAVQNGSKDINALIKSFYLFQTAETQRIITPNQGIEIKKKTIRKRVEEIFRVAEKNSGSPGLLIENLDDLETLKNKEFIKPNGFNSFAIKLIKIFLKEFNFTIERNEDKEETKNIIGKPLKKMTSSDFQVIADLLNQVEGVQGRRIKEIYTQAYIADFYETGIKNDIENENANLREEISKTQQDTKKAKKERAKLLEYFRTIQAGNQSIRTQLANANEYKPQLEAGMAQGQRILQNLEEETARLTREIDRLTREIDRQAFAKETLERKLIKLEIGSTNNEDEITVLKKKVDEREADQKIDPQLSNAVTEAFQDIDNQNNAAAHAKTIPMALATTHTPTTTRPLVPSSESNPKVELTTAENLATWLKTEDGLEKLGGDTTYMPGLEVKITNALHLAFGNPDALRSFFEEEVLSFQSEKEVYFALISIENLIIGKEIPGTNKKESLLRDPHFKAATILSCIEAFMLYSQKETEDEIENKKEQILSTWLTKLEHASQEDLKSYISEIEEQIEQFINDTYIAEWETAYIHAVERIINDKEYGLQEIANNWPAPETTNHETLKKTFDINFNEASKKIPVGIPIKEPEPAETDEPRTTEKINVPPTDLFNQTGNVPADIPRGQITAEPGPIETSITRLLNTIGGRDHVPSTRFPLPLPPLPTLKKPATPEPTETPEIPVGIALSTQTTPTPVQKFNAVPPKPEKITAKIIIRRSHSRIKNLLIAIGLLGALGAGGKVLLEEQSLTKAKETIQRVRTEYTNKIKKLINEPGQKLMKGLYNPVKEGETKQSQETMKQINKNGAKWKRLHFNPDPKRYTFVVTNTETGEIKGVLKSKPGEPIKGETLTF